MSQIDLYERLCGERQCKPNRELSMWFETPTSRLDLSRQYVGSDAGFECVLGALEAVDVQEINLTHSMLSSQSMSCFLRAAEKFSALHSILLSNNSLNADHGRMVLRLVRINSGITHVELGDAPHLIQHRSNDIPDRLKEAVHRQLQFNSMVCSTCM